MKDALLAKFRDRTARIGIIGQGYVGLPLALVFNEAGFPVIGFDVDPRKIEALRKGESYIQHIGAERVAAAVKSGRFHATADFDGLRECDAILICVPTPLGAHREPDNSYIHIDRGGDRQAAAPRAARRPRVDDLPGHDRRGGAAHPRDERPAMRRSDFLLAFSPEREDPGTQGLPHEDHPEGGGRREPGVHASWPWRSTAPRVDTGGAGVVSARVAESAKLLENIFRSVNIALVNELKMIFDRMGIDIWEVIEAAKTKPFGFMPFYPGPGLGGHCIPLDPFYLSWKAAEHGQWTRFIELAGEINTSMPRYVVDKVGDGAERATARRSRGRGSSCWGWPTRPTSTTTASRRRTRSSSCCRRRAPASTTATRSSRRRPRPASASWG